QLLPETKKRRQFSAFLVKKRPPTMNRIYQGRVTNVEISDGKDKNGNTKWKKLDDWQSALWQHHELFQDAVNYYLVALLALAIRTSNRLYPIRARIAQSGSEHAVWEAFRRRGSTRM